MTMRRSVRVMLIVLLAGSAMTVWGSERIATDAQPYLAQGHVMAPMRAVFEWLGAEVGYDASTGTITAHRGETEIQLSVGDRHALVNGERKTFAPRVASRDGRTFVPLRFVAEALGAQVNWDATSRLVTIDHAGRSGNLCVPEVVPPWDLPRYCGTEVVPAQGSYTFSTSRAINDPQHRKFVFVVEVASNSQDPFLRFSADGYRYDQIQIDSGAFFHTWGSLNGTHRPTDSYAISGHFTGPNRAEGMIKLAYAGRVVAEATFVAEH